MKALILNSGLGRRMGVLTSEHPKCMTDISDNETILSRQLRLIEECGITDVVMTTGYFDKVLEEYCSFLKHSLNIQFIKNPLYDKTNYIYSIYCAKQFLQNDDIILMHGDLVFTKDVLYRVINSYKSCMTISSTLKLPEKDFKAVVDRNRIKKIGIEFFGNAVAAQPLYKIKKKDWNVWIERLSVFCEKGNRNCYAENAFNEVSDKCEIFTLDVKNELCNEIDTEEDLGVILDRLKDLV